jgi:hypothetical protein
MYIFLLERYKVINRVAEYERERKACYSARHVFGSTEPYVKTKSLQVKRSQSEGLPSKGYAVWARTG